jgi:hypothetical protein
MANVHISGLPRSGSTLLFNILRQNPKLNDISKNRYYGTDESIEELLLNKTQVLLTYRPILEVLASFVRLAEQYPEINFIDRLMLEEKFPALSYRPLNDARCDWLMRPYGAIDKNNSMFKNMVVHKEQFHLIVYDDLCINPKDTISKIYDFLKIEEYKHNFENIAQHDNSQDEKEFGIPTLHTIRSNISKSPTNPESVLSDYVIEKYSNAMDFFTKGWFQSLA